MISNTASNSEHLNKTQQLTQNAEKLISRKIWLPKFLYWALPYFYLLSGATALLATIYISDWFWVLPHYLLFAGACTHMGYYVYRRRRRPPT